MSVPVYSNIQPWHVRGLTRPTYVPLLFLPLLFLPLLFLPLLFLPLHYLTRATPPKIAFPTAFWLSSSEIRVQLFGLTLNATPYFVNH